MFQYLKMKGEKTEVATIQESVNPAKIVIKRRKLNFQPHKLEILFGEVRKRRAIGDGRSMDFGRNISLREKAGTK